MSPLGRESDIRDARVDSQKACAERDVLKQEKIFSRRIPLFSGTRLISFSKSVHRKMPRSQVSAFMFSRTYTYVHFLSGCSSNSSLKHSRSSSVTLARNTPTSLKRSPS